MGGYLWAVAGVLALMLLGGNEHPFTHGLALVLPGIAFLFAKPANKTTGRLLRVAAWALLAGVALAFLPDFYWPEQAWRTTAEGEMGLDLPAMLSVQPWISMESFLLLLGGIAWFFALSRWRLNAPGRRHIFFWICCMVGVLALIVIVGNLMGLRYPGAKGVPTFSFFSDHSQMEQLLALGGVAAFGFAMEGLRSRGPAYIAGFPAAGLSLFALVTSSAGLGAALFFFGIFVWFVFAAWRTAIPAFHKIALPVLLLVFGVFLVSLGSLSERASNFFTEPHELNGPARLELYGDTLSMLADAPLSGFGLGNFSAVFPQYRELSSSPSPVEHPESSVLLLAAEGGLLATGLGVFFLCAYFGVLRGAFSGRSGNLRILAWTVLLVFMVGSIVDVTAHRPGTAYFAILFAALALPKPLAGPAKAGEKALGTRVFGGVLAGCGILWMAGALFGFPTHSELALEKYGEQAAERRSEQDHENATAALDRLISVQPLNWEFHSRRAQIILEEKGDVEQAMAGFRRARFVEPVLGKAPLREGYALLFHAPKQAISAWREALLRETANKDLVFSKMIRTAGARPDLMERMSGLSGLSQYYRLRFLLSLRGEMLNRELQKQNRNDPGFKAFDEAGRTHLVAAWIKRGDAEAAESFLQEHGASLKYSWWLRSLLKKERARFNEALTFLREKVPAAEIPAAEENAENLTRLRRRFAARSNNMTLVSTLLREYLDREAYEEALEVVETVLENEEPPEFAYYWRAELLYRLNEPVESWYAYETHIKRMEMLPPRIR
ncbi:MAG: O-antigen ligase family protein [Opitutales bacterium]